MKDSDWGYRDIPIAGCKVESKADKLTGEIELVTKNAEKLMREIIATKAAHVRARLIELGWTPPDES